MIWFAGGKKVLVINCIGCPSNASQKNVDCLNHLSKFKDYDYIILDKGVFIKLIDGKFGYGKESVFPGFTYFVIRKIDGDVIEKTENVKLVKSETEIFYEILPPESKLEKDEIDEINYAFDDIRKGNEPKLNEKLSAIVKKYTEGFNVLEDIMKDKNITDIYINPGDLAIYVNHRKYGNIKTNIILLPKELERISTKLRIYSGRPFDESIPEIHLDISELNARVTGIREPLTFKGIGFAIRKHTDKPLTIEKLVKEGLFSKKIGALLWFLVNAGASILISGNRGSGKTTLLGALMQKLPKDERIIVIEDIDELPVKKMMEEGYNIVHMRIKATESGFEKTAEEALKVALRLGESTLIIGEVRGEEAKYLFEAMRIGAIGNTVLGTIHGSRVYDVFDRVVNDLGVPRTSFKATDFIIMLNLLKDEKKGTKIRKLDGIYYVDKKWEKEPKFIKIADNKRLIDTKPLKEFAKRMNTTLQKALNDRIRKI